MRTKILITKLAWGNSADSEKSNKFRFFIGREVVAIGRRLNPVAGLDRWLRLIGDRLQIVCRSLGTRWELAGQRSDWAGCQRVERGI
jgi:hypothetical protein